MLRPAYHCFWQANQVIVSSQAKFEDEPTPF
jgi:hypothetical protein